MEPFCAAKQLNLRSFTMAVTEPYTTLTLRTEGFGLNETHSNARRRLNEHGNVEPEAPDQQILSSSLYQDLPDAFDHGGLEGSLGIDSGWFSDHRVPRTSRTPCMPLLERTVPTLKRRP